MVHLKRSVEKITEEGNMAKAIEYRRSGINKSKMCGRNTARRLENICNGGDEYLTGTWTV
jgi:hypothetical protein